MPFLRFVPLFVSPGKGKLEFYDDGGTVSMKLSIIMEPWGGKRGGSSLSYKSLIRVYQISPTPGKTVFIPWSNL
jgi:hypothetical protein